MSHLSASPSSEQGPTRPLLELVAIEKQFGGVRALRGADLTLARRGMVLGLIGENGSGKSSLLRVLSGQIAPDAGRVCIGGDDVRLGSPHAALRHGVAMVSQETSVAAELSVAENIFLGGRMSRGRFGIDWRATALNARALMDQVGLRCSPESIVGGLRPDERQLVEIARALSFDSRILVLDEPTTSLSEGEVEALFGVIANLKSRGISIIFVSHKLSELFGIADHLTVLRDGTTVADGPVASFTPESLVEAMVSEHRAFEEVARVPIAQDEPVAIAIRALTVPGTLRDVELSAQRGEIVGLAGLEGCGRSDLLRTIFNGGAAAGEVFIDGNAMRPHSPASAIGCGLGYVPADRKSEGLVLSMSVRDNLNMVSSARVARLRRPRRGLEDERMHDVVQQTRLRASSGDARVGDLSGGNQQKVVLGKWLLAKPRVLLLDEPTRGVDVAAKADIHRLLRSAAKDGTTILVSSSEGSELRELCDRILVMFRGAVVKSFPAAEATDAAMARYAGGLL